MRFVACVGIIALASQAHCTAAGPVSTTPLTGDWGGVHAALALTATGGTIEYDCAHGALDAPVRPDRGGSFDVAGTHVREHGGPIREDEVLEAVPARYVGQVRGDRLTLRVIATPDTLGPFTLHRGAAPQLFKCL